MFHSQPGLTQNESMEILALYQPVEVIQRLSSENVVKQAVEIYQNLPIAVAIMAGLKLKTVNEWKNLVDKLQIDEEDENEECDLRPLIQFSLSQMEEKDCQLIRLLGVYNPIPIPIQSIYCLWRQNQEDTIQLLKRLDEKSLLLYQDDDGCIYFQNAVIDYLQYPIDEEQSQDSYIKRLNQTLVERYLQCYQGDWNAFKEDSYFFDHIVDHAIKGDCSASLETMMADWSWIVSKWNLSSTQQGLITDLKSYKNYLSPVDEKKKEIKKIYSIMKEFGSYLSFKKIDLIQFLLLCSSRYSLYRNKALKLAEEKAQIDHLPYAYIAKYPKWKRWGTGYTQTFMDFSRKITTCSSDIADRCSTPYERGGVLVPATMNNKTEECEVVLTVVKEDDETDEEFNISSRVEVSNQWVTQIRIGPKGHRDETICFAFAISEWKADIGQYSDTWKVFYGYGRREYEFEDEDGNHNPSKTLANLEFPAKWDLDEKWYILTLASDRKSITMPIMNENVFRRTEKSITSDNEIQACKYLANDTKIMFWYHYGKPSEDLAATSAIEVWQVDPFGHQYTCRVQQNIQYADMISFDGAQSANQLRLFRVECVIRLRIYTILWYKGISTNTSAIGFLSSALKDNREDFVPSFNHRFKPLYSHEEGIIDLAISDVESYLAILNMQFEILIFNPSQLGTKPYKKLFSAMGTIKLFFCPTTVDLYTYSNDSREAYKYIVVENNDDTFTNKESTIPWRPAKRRKLTKGENEDEYYSDSGKDGDGNDGSDEDEDDDMASQGYDANDEDDIENRSDEDPNFPGAVSGKNSNRAIGYIRAILTVIIMKWYLKIVTSIYIRKYSASNKPFTFESYNFEGNHDDQSSNYDECDDEMMDDDDCDERSSLAEESADEINNRKSNKEEIVYSSSCCYINNIPYVAKLLEMKKWRLKLQIYQGEELEELSSQDFDDHKAISQFWCFLYDDLNSVILIKQCRSYEASALYKDRWNRHNHISIRQFNNLQSIDKCSWLVDELLVEGATIEVLSSRYRRADSKYLFIIDIQHSDGTNQTAVMGIQRDNGKLEMYYDPNRIHRKTQILHFDDSILALQQESFDRRRNLIRATLYKALRIDSCNLFKLEDNIMETKLFQSQQYYKDANGFACKINIGETEANIVTSSWKKENMIKNFGHYTTDLFMNYASDLDGCYFIQKGEDVIMIGADGKLNVKGYQNAIRHFNLTTNLCWNSSTESRFFMVVEKLTCKIQLYDKNTMQLVRTFQSPLLFGQLEKIYVNRQQSYVICRYDSHLFYIIKLIK
ncbi:uncharacterized protein TRIADDRAFT_60835 [Trichoplax adhaerens]|uniref:APAF-1 helical domain-containing protein n=1 Tax=Trichoplax adhaerens TaxID=10228 RepID=B3S9A6_TRIAD|nr:predicted protein [Trichoplax adhaerens]EDV20670.1 predicted protein [Trichoplax adhaerens]|eukprot:XP_002116870.1 predicted protein [Trichoplax adhaerens]